MKSGIKTTNNEWRDKFYILGGVLIITTFLFLGFYLFVQDEIEELEKQIKETKENSIQAGQNSTVNYIIGNKKYPTKFKGNIVWLTKKDLCEED